MRTSTRNTLWAAGALAVLVALPGCSTLQSTTGKPPHRPEPLAVASGEQEAAPPIADATRFDASSETREPGKHLHFQNLVSRGSNTKMCGAAGVLVGTLGPLYPPVLVVTGGLSVFAIPVTAPAFGIMSAIDGAKGKCPAGRRTATAVQTTPTKRQANSTRSTEAPQGLPKEDI